MNLGADVPGVMGMAPRTDLRFVASPQGPVAAEMTTLMWVLVALGGAVLFVFVLGLLRGLFRPSSDDGTDAKHDRWLAVGGVAVPTVIIVVTFAFTLGAMRGSALGESDITVEVIGHQWWWELRYDGFTTANEIVIPAGQPVQFELHSQDVIHSFWVPELGGKIDAFPDYTNSITLQADSPGEYEGACAEFCGLQHALMRLRVIAVTPEQFAEWADQQRQPALEPTDPLATQGREVFESQPCAVCHTIRGTSAVGNEGPDLTHLASRDTLAGATLPNDPEHLRQWIEFPQELKRGIAMPNAVLSDEELDAVVAYLGTLR